MVIQISDLHIGAAGSSDPLADARAAIDAVRAFRPRPEAVLVSGDLAEHGAAAEYELVRSLTAEVEAPVHVLAGNHDDRAALRAAFPIPGAPADRYRWAARCGPLRLVGCDSTRPRHDDGRLPADELVWLGERLAEDTATPTIVAMHHPPLAVGIPFLDGIGLPAADRAALGELLARFPQVQRVVTGHVHLAASGRSGPVAVATCASTWRERLRLELGVPELTIVREAAGMLVHALVGGELVTHAQPLPQGVGA